MVDAAESPEFARVKDQNFVIGEDDEPFRFVGANSFLMLKNAYNEATRVRVDQVFDTAQLAGLSVVRMWAFWDGDDLESLQKEPGVLCEPSCCALDYVVAAARSRGVKLILCLTNYWNDFGGVLQYVKWASNVDEPKSEDFFSNDTAIGYFKEYARAIVNRVNTLTGVKYRDDPTIFAWDVMNEPRCPGDDSCQKIKDFLTSFCKFMKAEAPHQLLTVGVEGFFGEPTPKETRDMYNPYIGLANGSDFCTDFDIPEIDFACIHLWPDNWGVKHERVKFIDKWIRCHLTLARDVLKMPLVMQEFNMKSEKQSIFEQVFRYLLDQRNGSPSLAGALFWHIEPDDYEDKGHYRIMASKSIISKLKALSDPQDTRIQAEQDLVRNASMGKEETESWKLLKLCWNVVQGLKRA